MPASTVCTISAEVAIALRDLLDAVRTNTPGGHFRCPECGEPVRPHGGATPHFEHLRRNPDCPV